MSAISEFSCESCGSLVQVEAHLRTAACPYCASPAVIERPLEAGRPAPLFVLGFVVPHERALAEARRWIRRRWFVPEALRKAQVESIRGIYVPSYLFSAAADASYTAQIGENYTETYTTTNSKGQTVTRTRTRTEWRSLSGRYAAYVSDIVVTASRGISNHELEGVEPFDLRALHRYTPRLLSGWIAEEASMPAEQCRELAVSESMTEIQRRVAAHLPGDKQRNLQVQAHLNDIEQELLLVPVYVLPVRYGDEEVVRILVNGQTAKVHSKLPRSWTKITVIIILVVILAAIGGYLATHR